MRATSPGNQPVSPGCVTFDNAGKHDILVVFLKVESYPAELKCQSDSGSWELKLRPSACSSRGPCGFRERSGTGK